mmetsp:Transcript_15311/g.61593  ORF Transcript_15311/g.61593 Transcript_15311/m.61593 type:complete len:324 (+) Transcript_15311:1274-2245(+)
MLRQRLGDGVVLGGHLGGHRSVRAALAALHVEQRLWVLDGLGQLGPRHEALLGALLHEDPVGIFSIVVLPARRVMSVARGEGPRAAREFDRDDVADEHGEFVVGRRVVLGDDRREAAFSQEELVRFGRSLGRLARIAARRRPRGRRRRRLGMPLVVFGPSLRVLLLEPAQLLVDREPLGVPLARGFLAARLRRRRPILHLAQLHAVELAASSCVLLARRRLAVLVGRPHHGTQARALRPWSRPRRAPRRLVFFSLFFFLGFRGRRRGPVLFGGPPILFRTARQGLERDDGRPTRRRVVVGVVLDHDGGPQLRRRDDRRRVVVA